MHTILALCTETAWESFRALEGSWLGQALPACAGLYRIRLVEAGQSRVAYIGQSGNLKERIGALRAIYRQFMPYRAPHTAAPALWAWRQLLPESHFEVSVAPFPTVPRVMRLGLECLAIALHRQQTGQSPLANFGRMPAGYRASSGNDGRLVTRGKRFRGGPTAEIQENHRPGIPPVGPLMGGAHSRYWCCHVWTPWVELSRLRPVGQEGLYRLRAPGCEPLILLGQGKLGERLQEHRHRAGLQCSWVSGEWLPHQRLELLTDLIGAHVLTTETLPLLQFEHLLPPDEPGSQRKLAAS